MPDTFSLVYLELDGNAIDGDPFCDELNPDRALKVLAEIIVVKPRDQVTLPHPTVPQQDNLFAASERYGKFGGGGGGCVAAQLE